MNFPSMLSLPKSFGKQAFVAGLGAVSALSSVNAYAGGGAITIINWHKLVLSNLGVQDTEYWWPIMASVFTFLLVTVVGLLGGLHKLVPEKLSDEELLPPKKFGVRGFLELCWAVVSSTLESVIGEKHWQKFAPLLGGTFFFILLTNLAGIVPGFTPATEQVNMTLGMAIVIFLMFNFYGLKYGGMDYIKHMAGPIWWLSVLIFPIEFIGMCARPISLSLRLFGNIAGDHLVFGVFSGLVKQAGMPFLPVPAALLGFGTLVACLQSFIFMTLSAVYIKLAIETAHHADHH
jgi:F-type H+-transporting ATPase subunit a